MDEIYAFMKKGSNGKDFGTFHSLNNYSISDLEKIFSLSSELKDMTLSLRTELEFISYKWAAQNPKATPADLLGFNSNLLSKIMTISTQEIRIRNHIEKKKKS